jgi:hypothetical protein
VDQRRPFLDRGIIIDLLFVLWFSGLMPILDETSQHLLNDNSSLLPRQDGERSENLDKM